MSEKQTWYCARCGSHDIRHDATAQWDRETETWTVLDVLDATWCHPCQLAHPGSDAGEPVYGFPAGEQADQAEQEAA